MLKPMTHVDAPRAVVPSRDSSPILSSTGSDEAGASPTEALAGVVAGTVTGVEGDCLWLRLPAGRASAEEVVSVRHELPGGIRPSLRLEALVGREVRISVVHERTSFAGVDRTLTIADAASGRTWLVARTGTVHGVAHTLDGSAVRAVLSQRDEGPLVIGTPALQWMVTVGQPAMLPMADGSVYRALLLERRVDGTASYIIADEGLFHGFS